MFLGTYTPKIDDKGRFFIPAKYRDDLESGVVITRQQDRCLAIYPMETFVEMTKKVGDAPATVKQIRDFQRWLAAGASDQVPDKQGRLTIPQHLRDYAGLETDIVVIGSFNRIEVWDAQTYREYSEQQEPVFAEMNEDLFGNS